MAPTKRDVHPTATDSAHLAAVARAGAFERGSDRSPVLSGGQESYRISGVMADASWPAGEPVEAPVGTPRFGYVMGADATSIYRARGERPQRMPQPPIVRWA